MILFLSPIASQARWLSTEIGRFMTMDTYPGDQEEPMSLHKYAYAADNPVNNSDPSGNDYGDFNININSIGGLMAKIGNSVTAQSGLGVFGGNSIIVGFYGADVWGSHDANGANPELAYIASTVRAPIYRSLDIWDPYQYVLRTAINSPPDEPIKIFGHSWGGVSAVKLARWLGRSVARTHEIDVYTVDPVSLLRTRPISVPSSVTYFWNRYERTGGPVLGPIALHGRWLPSNAQNGDSDEHQVYGVDHVSIVNAVAPELVQKLKGQ